MPLRSSMQNPSANPSAIPNNSDLRQNVLPTSQVSVLQVVSAA
jgi:hypothetical protein